MGILNSSVNFIIYRWHSHHQPISSLLNCTFVYSHSDHHPQFCGSHFPQRISSVDQMPKNCFRVSKAFQRYGDNTASLWTSNMSFLVLILLDHCWWYDSLNLWFSGTNDGVGKSSDWCGGESKDAGNCLKEIKSISPLPEIFRSQCLLKIQFFWYLKIIYLTFPAAFISFD